MLYSPVVRRRGRSFCLNVFIDIHLCYVCDDLFDYCERPFVGWPHKISI